MKPIDEISERFRTIEPFSESDDEVLRSIAGHFSLVQLAQGNALVRQGKDADSMFVLLDGELSVAIAVDTNESREITHLMPGAIVGEMALIAGSKRSATVNAVSQCILAKLTIPAFDALLNQHPRIALRLSELSSLRLRSNRLIAQLTKFLNSSDPELLSAVEDSVEWITLQKGEHLFRQGDSSEAAYLVVSGRLYVTQLNNRDEEHFVREVDPGDMVGATDLLLETERTNTVYAVRDTELARLSFSHIGALTDRFPKTALGLMRMVLRRNSSTVKILKKENTSRISIALVPLDPDLDMEAIQSSLTKELERIGSTTVLSPKRVGAHLRESRIAEMTDTDASNMRLVQWVSQVENAHQFTIYQADSAEGNWSQLAIRRADKVIFVAFADGGSHIREIETWAEPQHEDLKLSIGLVLVHEASAVRPFDTARWLKDRNIGSIYHIREDSREDMGRLARRLAGRPVSLVLGGGGARAWAHIGVIRACEDLGIPIDIVGGTSMGGAIAAYKAKGLTAAEVFEECIRISRNIKDYTLPIASIMSGKRIYKHIDVFAGRWDIEDLWLPFFSVSTNITTAHAVCHRSGNLGLALRATLAIPGVFPPVVDGRNLLVDGGVLHNLPVEFMRDINPTGSIIAIDVLPRTGPRAKYDYGIHLSGWEILWSRIAPWRKTIQMPSIPGAILRSMFIGSSVAQHKIVEDELADLYINIDVRGIGMLEFDAIERIESIGYEKSIRQLEQWAQA